MCSAHRIWRHAGDALTSIYGEEDWTQMRQQRAEDEAEEARALEERMAGLA